MDTINFSLLSNHIASWLKDYTLTNQLKTLIVGVSGGIDSAVASTLAAKTGIPTYVLNIPVRQKKNQENLSSLHLTWLKKNYPNVYPIKIELTGTFNEFLKAWEQTGHKEIKDHLHAQANTRSRLRMISLYHIATATRGLVVGTGNKIEDYGIGFFTKYGDGGIDIAPLADLYKSEVYCLAKILGIETAIQNALPTDGLWDDERSDQDQIGSTYDELEKLMREKEGEKISGITEKSRMIYDRLYKTNRHKLSPIPTFKLIEHGFSRDTNSSKNNQ